MTTPVLDARFAIFEAKMDARFAAVDCRFVVLEARMDAGFDQVRAELVAKMEKVRADLVRWVFVVMLGNVALSTGATAILNALQHGH